VKTVQSLICILSLVILFTGCGKKDAITAAIETAQANSLTTPIKKPLRICTLESLSDGTYLVCDDGTIQKLSDNVIGVDGSSCTVTSTDDGASIDCEDGTHADISNGEVVITDQTPNSSGPGTGSDSGSGTGSDSGSGTGSGSGNDEGDQDQDDDDEDQDNDSKGLGVGLCIQKCENDKHCKKECIKNHMLSHRNTKNCKHRLIHFRKKEFKCSMIKHKHHSVLKCEI